MYVPHAFEKARKYTARHALETTCLAKIIHTPLTKRSEGVRKYIAAYVSMPYTA
jgi:hypothetical protein